MSELPTAEDLAARLDEVSRKIDAVHELDAMNSLAEQAAADYSVKCTEEETFEPEPALAAELPGSRPTRIPLPRLSSVTQPPSVLDQQRVASDALQMAAATVADWDLYADRVAAATTAAPERLQSLLNTGDPAIVAAHLVSAYRVAKTGDTSQTMKLQAQTMSGAGGRPLRSSSDEQHFEAIKNARKRGYWEGAN